jgi:hypothetical protein
MLTETSIIDKIELVPNAVQIRHKNIIEKDGVEIASTFHREVVTKDSVVNHLDKKTQAICELWLK